ncbi:adenylyltransferase/cytidyltransferase family protein [Candidatus Daviesbacteria bacterium]|nr:adenylyltransferase/cytidyltransferase family protein [Candidatus Daviesbacteria bacterium]
MEKIVSIAKIAKIAKRLRADGKKIVLAGGCFDILHIGHVTFIEKAKKSGDKLILLLEPDAAIKKLKGENRPFNNQKTRAKILSAIEFVDFVVLLPKIFRTPDYNKLVENILPAVIAVTEGDINMAEKRLQAKKAGGIVKVVLKKISEYSTTKLLGYF